jgi:hypothetical protein
MKGRRIGRRLALREWLQNPCSQAVRARTLARKVFHYLCYLFSPWHGGQRLVGKAILSMTAPLGDGAYPSPGARPFRWRGGARRFVCSATPAITPLITSSLVTKGKKTGGVR